MKKKVVALSIIALFITTGFFATLNVSGVKVLKTASDENPPGFQYISGTVYDDKGNPVKDATVEAYPWPMLYLEVSDTTNQHGNYGFHVNQPWPGYYQLKARKEGVGSDMVFIIFIHVGNNDIDFHLVKKDNSQPIKLPHFILLYIFLDNPLLFQIQNYQLKL